MLAVEVCPSPPPAILYYMVLQRCLLSMGVYYPWVLIIHGCLLSQTLATLLDVCIVSSHMNHTLSSGGAHQLDIINAPSERHYMVCSMDIQILHIVN